MSTFLGLYGVGHGYQFSALYNNDSLQASDYRVMFSEQRESHHLSLLWPRSSFTGQDYANMPMIWESMHQVWDYDALIQPGGTHVRKKITGISRNSGGTPIGGVTVMLYNTSTNVLVDKQVSDSGGNYTLSDPNGVTCYIVAYLPGSPDTAGSGVNTLTGT
jgi:hypothetical protein